MAGEYHFDDVTAVHTTEDGQYLIMEATSPHGVVGLRIAAKHAARTTLLVMEAAAVARKITDPKILQTVALRELRVMDDRSGPNVQLLATIHTGAPPIALSMPRVELEAFARGILQTAGELDVPRPRDVQ